MLLTILCWVVALVCLFLTSMGAWWLLQGRGGGKWLDHLIAIGTLLVIGGFCLVQAIRRSF